MFETNALSWLVIINPNAGKKKGIQDWPKISGYLKKHNISYHSIFTERRLHALELTKEYIKKGFSNIIVVGGDGTMNEVVNGIFLQKKVPSTSILLGMISVGTGNDWGRMFKIPCDYEEAAKTIKQNNVFIQDAGCVKFFNDKRSYTRYFANIAGLGFDAAVAKQTNKLKEKGRSGAVLYLINIFRTLLKYKHNATDISIDGKRFYTDLFSMNVGICKYSGGGMMQVPDAIPDDGMFNLTIINKLRKRDVIRHIGKLYNGKIARHPKVDMFIGKSVNVVAEKTLTLETDGETLGHAPFEFTIIPKSIKIIVGEDFTPN